MVTHGFMSNLIGHSGVTHGLVVILRCFQVMKYCLMVTNGFMCNLSGLICNTYGFLVNVSGLTYAGTHDFVVLGASLKFQWPTWSSTSWYLNKTKDWALVHERGVLNKKSLYGVE